MKSTTFSRSAWAPVRRPIWVVIALTLWFAQCTVTHTQQTTVTQAQPAPVDTVHYEVPEDAIVVQPKPYRASATKVNDLVHTKLDMRFNWEKKEAHGKAWITLHPHYYPTDSLSLNAKRFIINKVELVLAKGIMPLKYNYDSLLIKIQLDKTYRKEESYTVFIDYTARPDSVPVSASLVSSEDKGLYFINADEKNPDVPRQLWTQGETESNSCWFPTIDHPNQKMTWELSLTVEDGFVTFSNGLMTSSKENNDGTHTDTWKLDQPFAPYLACMAAGPFSVVKDKWKNIDVNYYVDKKYEPYARDIFGNTPEMIQYFSDLLKYPYPWPKYSQMAVHDFVTGAMENVSATIHGGFVQQTRREMLDGDNEDVIAHELFHQWFGDLVTTESWSNITLNESFAEYGSCLWNEYKYGKDAGDYTWYAAMRAYQRQPENISNALVRYYYDSADDLFDRVSYEKGACILHMLRNYVGDEAFFASLNRYLTENQYQSAEVANLRLAFEQVTGKDLSWFFNQWYFAPGHPVLNISYAYHPETKSVDVTVEQTQDTRDGTPVYQLPVAMDVYAGGKVNRYRAVFEGKKKTLSFPCDTTPDLVNFDGDKMLLCKKTDNKSDTAFAFQFRHAPKFLDRLEAIQYFQKNISDPFASVILEEGLNDPFWYLRQWCVSNIKTSDISDNEMLRYKVTALADSDPKSSVRVAALRRLAASNDPEIMTLLEQSLNDSSYAVISESLEQMMKKDTARAFAEAQRFEQEESDEMKSVLGGIYASTADASKLDFFIRAIQTADRRNKYDLIENYGTYLARLVSDPKAISKGLPVLYDAAENNQTWWIRMKGMMALQTVQQALEEKMTTLEKNPAGDNYDELHLLGVQLEELKQNIDRIKASEKDEQLKGIYNR